MPSEVICCEIYFPGPISWPLSRDVAARGRERLSVRCTQAQSSGRSSETLPVWRRERLNAFQTTSQPRKSTTIREVVQLVGPKHVIRTAHDRYEDDQTRLAYYTNTKRGKDASCTKSRVDRISGKGSRATRRRRCTYS